MKSFQALCLMLILVLATSLTLTQAVQDHEAVQNHEQIQNVDALFAHEQFVMDPEYVNHEAADYHDALELPQTQSHELLASIYSGYQYHPSGAIRVRVKQVFGYRNNKITYYNYRYFTCSHQNSCTRTKGQMPCCPCGVPPRPPGLSGTALTQFNNALNSAKKCFIPRLGLCLRCQKACSVNFLPAANNYAVPNPKFCFSATCNPTEFRLVNCGWA